MLERIGVVSPLRVENRHSVRQRLIGHMMVADDEVDAETLGIGDHVVRLDATVEDDDQLHPRLVGIVDAFLAHAIPLVVAVGDIIIDVRIELLQKLVHQCHGGAAVDIVVTIDEHALLAPHSVVEPVHCHIHILHQERIDEVGELGTEEPLCSALRRDATAYEQVGKDRTHFELLAQFFGLSCFFW